MFGAKPLQSAAISARAPCAAEASIEVDPVACIPSGTLLGGGVDASENWASGINLGIMLHRRAAVLSWSTLWARSRALGARGIVVVTRLLQLRRSPNQTGAPRARPRKASHKKNSMLRHALRGAAQSKETLSEAAAVSAPPKVPQPPVPPPDDDAALTPRKISRRAGHSYRRAGRGEKGRRHRSS